MLRQSVLAALTLTVLFFSQACCCLCGTNDDPMGNTTPQTPDLPPEPPTTVLESRAKAPPWAEKSKVDAPQSLRAPALFKAAQQTPAAATLDRDVVICRIVTSKNHDTFQPSDLKATLLLGDHGPFEVWGPEDNLTMYASVPIVSLGAGARVKLSIVDRDATTTEFIEELEGEFKEAPWTLSGDESHAECAVLLRSDVEAEVNRTNRDSISTAAKLPSSLKPKPKKKDWGYASTLIGPMKRNVESMAAMVGWADTRVQRWVEEVKQAEATWDGLTAASIEELHSDLPTRGTEVFLKQASIGVKVLSTGCGQKAMLPYQGKESLSARDLASSASCLMKVEVKNKGVRPIHISAIGHHIGESRVWLVGPRGRSIDLGLLRIEPEEGEATSNAFELGPDKKAVLVLAPLRDVKIDKGPQSARLLRLFKEDTVFLRLD